MGRKQRGRKLIGRNRKKQEKAKRRKKLRDGCTGKKRFTDPKEAYWLAAKTIQRKRSLKAMGVYICRKCSHYHLTSKPDEYCVAVIEQEETDV